MFQGLRTVVYGVSDIDAAREWYTKILGKQPYFSEPFYVGFSVGGFELGLDPDPEHAPGCPGGVSAYWGVADAAAELQRLLDLGARPHRDVQEVGGGIKVASVQDPFGNVFGIIENPNFAIEP